MTDPTNRATRAADVRAQQASAEKRRRLRGILGAVAALALVIFGALAFQQFVAKDPTVSTSSHFVAIGPTSAPHTVVIYEDFLCPFCGAFERHTSETLATLAADGKVRVQYRPFELFTNLDYSKQSAEVFGVVLATAGDGVAKKFHDALYADQPDERGPYPTEDDLIAVAVKAGADEAKVRAGIKAGDGADWVDGANTAAGDAGVRSTPTVLLDGKPFQDGNSVEDLGDNLVKKLS